MPTWPLILAVWTVPALLAGFETYVFWRMGGHPYPFWRAMAMEGPAWLTYAAMTPVIAALARRFPIQRPRLARNLALHVLGALTTGVGYAVLATAASRAFTPVVRTGAFGHMALQWYLSALPLTTVAYFAILGAAMALAWMAEARQRERHAALLESQLATARLGALQMQLHPHFLFNTLNAINVLARDGDTAGVSRMLELLSELLRDVLRSDVAQEIPLSAELDFARRYLAIEQVRFTDRLRVRESIEPAALDARVPSFVLQPLIENALRHGLASRANGGTLEIGARLRDGGVELVVDDDGAGLPDDFSSDDFGIGLANTTARLRARGGNSATLSIEPGTTGGTTCRLWLPQS